jgi:pSer/pThr/pTyr-binding forkhead associated (FHA) protein
MPVSPVALHLLDASQAHPLQSWEFEESHEITIGRASDNDVQIGSPYVSRAHAVIQSNNGQWELRVPSQQGAVVAGKKVFHCFLENDFVFQLGPGGPYLRFHCADVEKDDEPQVGRDTMCLDFDSTPWLILDETQRDQEVRQIVEEPYFQHLQKLAAQMRRSRPVGS